MLPFHQKLLAEGHTKRDTEALISQALRLDEHIDNPRLIYVSPELVDDLKDCKYRLGCYTSYKNNHRGISTFYVPHMSLHHQQGRKAYQDKLGKAPATTVCKIEKGDRKPSSTPGEYHGLLQALSSYIQISTTVVGSRSVHTWEVAAIRNKLRTKMDLYVDIVTQKILYML